MSIGIAIERGLQPLDRVRAPRVTAQLALVEQALGLWVLAERHLTDALSHRDDRWIRSRRSVLTTSLADIGRHLGSLDITTEVSGASISAGGEVVGTTPLGAPIRLPIGRADVEIAHEGYRTQAVVVEIERGALARQLVRLVPVPRAEPVVVAEPAPPLVALAAPPVSDPMPVPSAPQPDPGGGSVAEEWWFWTLLGVVVVGAGVGIGLGVALSSSGVMAPDVETATLVGW